MQDPEQTESEARMGRGRTPGAWPAGTSELAVRMRERDWRSPALGPTAEWPENLRSVVQLMLDSIEPTCLLWTPAGIHLYNDAYIPILHLRHPDALGREFAQVWPESAHLEEARYAGIWRTGASVVIENRAQVVFNRQTPRERYFTIYATPIRGRDGAVDGVVQRWFDTTESVDSQHRLRHTLARLDEHQAGLTLQLALSDAISDESARQRIQARSELQDREERLRLAIVAARLATWDWDVGTGKFIWSDQMYSMHGYAPNEIEPSFDAWAQRVHTEDLPDLLKVLERALDRRDEFAHLFRTVHPDGSIHWCSVRGRYFYEGHGHGMRMLAVAQDVTDEHRAQLTLRDIRLQQRALIEGVPQLIWRADSRGSWTWSSPQWTRYTELSMDASRGDGWLEGVHPNDRAQARAAWSRAASEGVFDVEYRIGPATGPYRWFQTRATPIRNEEAGVIEWLGTSTDVDELRLARERQKLLVAELQHRTRNLIGVVRALSAMTARETGSLESFQHHFEERLAALSRSQALLSRADAEPITLDALLRVELQALTSSGFGRQISIRGPEVRLENSVVQTFALAIHELATNALKHGALHTPNGRLNISWRLEANPPSQATLHLHWQELNDKLASVPLPSGPSGYGRELLERMLPYVLNAKTEYWITSAGAQCTIELPVRVDAASGLANIVAVQ